MAGQVKNTAANSALPRTPDGHPDLQGTYDLATMTPLERQPGAPPFLTKEEAEALEKAEVERRDKDNEPSNPDRPAPPVGGDTSAPHSFFEALEKAGGGPVGGYNRFWLNQGAAYTVVDGQVRTSIVVDPQDGHLPPYNAAARKRLAAARATPTSTAPERQEGIAEPPGAYDNPALPARIRFYFRSAGTAGLFLQRSASDCANSRLDHDSQRDGARRTHRAHERTASSQKHPPLDR
jgi:hypothetical protein